MKSADVVLNNFSAGVVSKLKIDFEQLSKINPKIIRKNKELKARETIPLIKRHILLPRSDIFF